MRLIDTLRRAGRALALAPTILSQANSFEANQLLGSARLNAQGLHRWRVRTADRLARLRRRRLESRIPAQWRDAFERDGFVVVENAMPAEDFARVREVLVERAWPVRDMVQGDTVTRRAAVDGAMLAAVPELAAFLRSRPIAGLFRYVSSFDVEPLFYLQSILKRGGDTADPQVVPHADTFHSSMKAWLFLQDVHEGEGAFSYVRGSHRVTPQRLAWHHDVANSLDGRDRMTRRGSFRARDDDLARMELGTIEELAVRANTLVVADTFGFHARGPSGPDLKRVEIWAYSRRNPFLPWLGGDPLSIPALAPSRMGWLWRVRDRFPRLLKQPWKDVGRKRMTDRP